MLNSELGETEFRHQLQRARKIFIVVGAFFQECRENGRTRLGGPSCRSAADGVATLRRSYAEQETS